jgi:hypothetical protein
MKDICEKYRLFQDDANVVRIPTLVKGKMKVPSKVEKEEILQAFAAKGGESTNVKIRDTLVLREPIVDRTTMTHSGDYQYQVLAAVDPLELVERDYDKLANGLYNLPFTEVLNFLQGVLDTIRENEELVKHVRDLTLKTAQHPDRYHFDSFDAFTEVLSTEVARGAVDSELALWGIPGSKFLDGWVQVPEKTYSGLAMDMASQLFQGELPPKGKSAGVSSVRAMPTRQLHITAGNAPAVPVISMLRAISTKSAAVIKSPFGAIIPGALVALAASKAFPDHPITQNMSIVYWPGGDNSVEDVLFLPTAFDRIIVWGSPDSVASVKQRAAFTPVVCFNPRYGLSFIGKEAQSDYRKAAVLASVDTMIWSQKACTASYVHYVEGSQADAEKYATELQKVMEKWEEHAPNYIPPDLTGKLRRMKRGKYMSADWRTSEKGGNIVNSVVVMNSGFDMMDHPMNRTIIVRPIDKLENALSFLHHGVAAVGVFPEDRRLALRDRIHARGVSYVMPLGQVERTYAGMSHDGMLVLNTLVDWKNS